MRFYKVIFHKNAEKFIKKNKKEGLKFYQAFFELAKDRRNYVKYDIKLLINRKDEYRLRIGKNRAIFKIYDEKIIIYVIDIASRGEIYK